MQARDTVSATYVMLSVDVICTNNDTESEVSQIRQESETFNFNNSDPTMILTFTF